MEIVIDFSSIPADNPIAFGWWFFKTIGWLFPVFLFVYGLLLVWQNYIRNNYRKTRNYILLAIDVPKNNEQTPRAVENIFSHLAGAHQALKFYHKWWNGEVPDSFSFEIVSLGGYIQFIVHFCDTYRDLVEAVIYAQYPDAEINEVENYTDKWNIKFPNDKYDLNGGELKLKENEVYPLITHKEFEDSISQEIKDPMASVLESLTRIGPGEEIWLQFVITPADNDWNEKAKPVIKKLIGAKSTTKKNWLDHFFDLPNIAIDAIITPPESVTTVKKDEAPTQMMYMTTGEKDVVSAIEHKVSKLGFHTRIRWIYLAEKPVFTKQKASKGLYGSFKQFNNLGLNSLKPDSSLYTGGIIFFPKIRLKWRQNKILWRYKDRAHSLSPGDFGFILNTEELASLWHFPILTVMAPLVKKTEAKKAEPPMSLPVEHLIPSPLTLKTSSGPPKASPPEDLPTE